MIKDESQYEHSSTDIKRVLVTKRFVKKKKKKIKYEISIDVKLIFNQTRDKKSRDNIIHDPIA